MIWVIVSLGLALAFAIGWIAYRKPEDSGILSASEKKIADSFDARKAATARESDDQLKVDLDRDILR